MLIKKELINILKTTEDPSTVVGEYCPLNYLGPRWSRQESIGEME